MLYEESFKVFAYDVAAYRLVAFEAGRCMACCCMDWVIEELSVGLPNRSFRGLLGMQAGNSAIAQSISLLQDALKQTYLSANDFTSAVGKLEHLQVFLHHLG